ncbi:hypothetical protein F4801DRAFT_574029 [Xylaria longipes]|nr:hypothetical protein F4801DRAFT_574029 [Xylaria longipes]RYC61048.1 hypothetical protein CHU98_g5163 [Xylaria longipes]
MAFPEVSSTCHDPEKASLTMATAERQAHHASDDEATEIQQLDTTIDYTLYSTKGLYGLFKASVREHSDRGGYAEISLNLAAMELLMDLAVTIALVIFMYYTYMVVAEEYAANSLKLDPGSHGAIFAQCTCSNAHLPIMGVQSVVP